MLSQEEIIDVINKEFPYLKDRYGVADLRLFGSYSRSAQSGESDIDVLVEFREVIDLIEFIKLENYLGDLLGCRVDLVMKDSLKPRIRDIILTEAVAI